MIGESTIGLATNIPKTSPLSAREAIAENALLATIEAGLSFLGLGVRPPLASWGTLIQDGYQYLSQTWVPVVVSSVALGLATLGFTLFGEALRDAVDPRIGREH